MMKSLAALLASTAIAWCSSAQAQEAAPTEAAPPQTAPTAVAPGEIPPADATPEPLWGTPPAPLPASATPAPAAVAPQPLPPGPVYPLNDPLEMRRIERQMKRHEREVIRLERAMAVEGNEFSEEKYDRYRNQTGAGIALVAIGGVSLITMVIYFFHVVVTDAAKWSSRDSECEGSPYDDYCSAEEQEDAERLGERPQRIALWSMLVTGIAGVGIGVPLLVIGKHGKGRQELLHRKDEILAPFDPSTATASVSLFADSEGNPSGLRLKVTF
jgi:hypothetical protein